MTKKQKKKRNKKYRPNPTRDRIDMRTGGRVKYQLGRAVEEPREEEMSIQQEDEDIEDLDETDDGDEGQEEDDTTTTTSPQMNRPTTASQERTDRIAKTAADIQTAAQGQVPEAAKIQDAQQVGFQRDAQGQLILDEQGNPVPLQDQQITTMDAPTTVGQQPVTSVRDEQVTTGRVRTAQTPAERQAAQITRDELDIVPTDAKIKAAEGDVSRIAEAAGVEKVKPIEGAPINIPAGALASRVTGVLSPEAKATAAKNAGTDLARVTRAKKQLRNAGLQEDAIAELGSNPEALEDRLTQFTEQERGLIAGLPEEALVSNQLDSLLNGIEEGEIPAWAQPAVASVESMLAQRGLSASSVGRDNLFNAIIQSSIPLAQSNAQAIQQSVSQQRSIEAQVAEANAQREQQVNLDKANKVFGMDMAQFNADQQTELANSKFLQSVSLTVASNDQQAAIQNAVLLSQANLAEANLQQQAEIQNAKNFLQMDISNLNTEQQSNIVSSQLNQQRILSNQSAQNAAAQFNAANEQQRDQFMMSLGSQMEQYNSSQSNAMEQFNATQTNAAEARDTAREADLNKFRAQLYTQVDQFNSQQDFARNQWNAQNAATVEASNVQWRRQANTVNTAAQNQVNMQNAMNAFNLSSRSMSFLWQELRDQADFDFRAFENEETRAAQVLSTAIANEGKAGQTYDDKVLFLIQSLANSFS